MQMTCPDVNRFISACLEIKEKIDQNMIFGIKYTHTHIYVLERPKETKGLFTPYESQGPQQLTCEHMN